MSIVRSASLDWGVPIHYRSLTIDHTKCGTADSANFTVYVGISEHFLKTQSNGGYVKYASGNDIVFTSDSAGTTLLNWEIDYYDPVGGNLYAWVLLANVSHSVNTIFYMNVGNVAYSAFQGGATGTAWSTNWRAVYHFANGTTLALTDSTTNTQTLSNNTPACLPVAGMLDGGVSCGPAAGASHLSRATPALPGGVAARSMGCWFKLTATGATVSIMGYGNNTFTSGTVYDLTFGITFLQLSAAASALRVTWVPDTNWHHLYVTTPINDDLTNSIMYLDGVAQTPAFLVTATINTTLTQLCVGNDSSLTYGDFNGSLDEARITTAVLSPSWILTMYNNESNFGTFCALGAWHT